MCLLFIALVAGSIDFAIPLPTPGEQRLPPTSVFDEPVSRATFHALWCVAVVLAWRGGANATAEQPAPARLPPRAERSPAERAEAAKALRAIYRRDPADWPPPTVDPGVAWQELALLPDVEHPAANPASAAKITLGKTLFFDARLSASGKLACVSCHAPTLGWADGRAVSEPRGATPARNAPTILNAAFQPVLFWDGRAASLEAQAEEALANTFEMEADETHVVSVLSRSTSYRRLYDAAFPDEPITLAGVVKAIACFERTVVGGESRFDDFLRGNEAALSDEELLGLDLFRRDARCMNCHHGPTLSDGRFHDLGLSFYGRTNEDPGRHAFTDDPHDMGRFRTPSLRHVSATEPLMHTGMFRLRGVLAMYNAGMATLRRQDFERDDPLFPTKSPLLRPLGLSKQDLADLEAFLRTLEEPRAAGRPPNLPSLDEPAVTASP